jgi:hypothetical protein
MPQKPLSPELAREALDAYGKFGTLKEAAEALGIARSTLHGRVIVAKNMLGAEMQPMVPQAPAPLPDDDIPTEDLISVMKRRFEKRSEHRRALLWRKYKVPTSGPYALMFFGDPHVDDNGCNWSLLADHCDLAASTQNLYAIAIGDQTNNWTGRLARLWAEQDTSSATAKKLVKWLLNESGVPWFMWLHGNHDAWQGPVSSGIIEGMNCHEVMMQDWEARVVLESPGFDLRLWAAHNFPGHSMYNKLHGPQKAALMKDWAHIYVAGHHHNWALHHEENAERGFDYWLARCRGYKHIDHYGELLGHQPQQKGSSILTVVDPSTQSVQCFSDPYEGVDFLKFKRAKQ